MQTNVFTIEYETTAFRSWKPLSYLFCTRSNAKPALLIFKNINPKTFHTRSGLIGLPVMPVTVISLTLSFP